MECALVDTAPSDAAQQLKQLKGTALLSFFRSLPWGESVAPHLENANQDELRAMLSELAGALPGNARDKIVVPVGEAGAEDYKAEIRAIYLLCSAHTRTAPQIISDARRAWSARAEDESGRIEVGASLCATFIKENPHRASVPISRALNALGLKCCEVPTASNNPSRFYVPSLRPAQAGKRLLAFCSSCVPVCTADGFVGRLYDATTAEKHRTFREVWDSETLRELDAPDARLLASFMANGAEPSSPSPASCRRALESYPKEPEGPGDGEDLTGSAPEPAVAASNDGGFLAEAGQIPGKSDESDGTGTRGARRARRGLRRGDRREHTAQWSLRSVRSSTSNDSGGSDDGSDAGSNFSLDASEVRPVRGRRSHPKSPGLPSKMLGILVQGGKHFEELFEPVRLDITTPKDLHKFLKYFNEGERVKTALSRSTGLTKDPHHCLEKLEAGKIHKIRPDSRLADTLSFPASSRKAPRLLHRWMSHGSIIPWLNALAARAGPPEKDSADGYTAREIMTAGLTLACLLNAFHPAHIIYSGTVEKLVRRLWVIEKSMSMDRQVRGGYVVKMLGFMGVGTGTQGAWWSRRS